MLIVFSLENHGLKLVKGGGRDCRLCNDETTSFLHWALISHKDLNKTVRKREAKRVENTKIVFIFFLVKIFDKLLEGYIY